jgi:hypothetical protein
LLSVNAICRASALPLRALVRGHFSSGIGSSQRLPTWEFSIIRIHLYKCQKLQNSSSTTAVTTVDPVQILDMQGYGIFVFFDLMDDSRVLYDKPSLLLPRLIGTYGTPIVV